MSSFDVAFDRLMEETPALTYEDIAVLRASVLESRRLQDAIRMEMEMILKHDKPCDMIFETADGLSCKIHGKFHGMRRVRLPLRRPHVRSFEVYPVPVVAEAMLVREYEFEKFVGGPAGRTAIYREVVT